MRRLLASGSSKQRELSAGRRMSKSHARAYAFRGEEELDISPEYLTKGTGVKIVNFYTSSRTISRRDSALICYSVLNAASVRLTPEVEELKPAINHCFSVSPDQTTTYQLEAGGTDGSSATASFELRVESAPPRIEMIAVSAKEIKRGDGFDMCYTVRNANRVRLEPPAIQAIPAEKRCFHWYPAQSAKYTLVASGDRGRTDNLSFTVRVRQR